MVVTKDVESALEEPPEQEKQKVDAKQATPADDEGGIGEEMRRGERSREFFFPST